MSAAPFLLSDAATIRRGARQDENSSPYPWVMIPPGGVSVFEHGSFATPAYGAQITLATYTVPDGWEGVLSDVMDLLLDPNGNFVEGSGSAFWDIDIDRPLGARTGNRPVPAELLSHPHKTRRFDETLASPRRLADETGRNLPDEVYRGEHGHDWRALVRPWRNARLGMAHVSMRQ